MWIDNHKGFSIDTGFLVISAMQRNAVLLGYSHTGAVARAIAARSLGKCPGRDELVISMFRMYNYGGNPPYVVTDDAGLACFNPLIIDEAKKSDAFYIASLGGNDWAVLSMMEHAQPFDFIMPGFEELPFDPGSKLIPAGYIKSVLRDLARRWMEQLRLLRKATESAIYLFMPPPPIGDNAFITRTLDEFFKNQTEFTRSVGSANLRLKMWLLQNALFREECAKSNVVILEAPLKAVDERGFLKAEYYGEDATHANPAYGELMLQQVENEVNSSLLWWYWFPD